MSKYQQEQENKISTHTSRVGCDCSLSSFVSDNVLFLLTHPVWDVTLSLNGLASYRQFLLTHPVWDVTKLETASGIVTVISTHTSRVGCDLLPLMQIVTMSISTHTSRVGCD